MLVAIRTASSYASPLTRRILSATICSVDFELSSEQRAVRELCRDFAKEVVAPAAEELDRNHRFGGYPNCGNAWRGGSAEPRRFTFGKKRDGSPRWSPDGTRLAFTSTRDTEKAGQLFVIPVEGGEAQRLTDRDESVEEVAWSPDSGWLAFTSRVPSCYFFIGTGNPETGKIWGHHHPKFDIDERCLGIGVEVMVGAALRYLEENAS